MQIKDRQVIVAGHICLDIIPEFLFKEGTRLESFMKPGKLINMGKAVVSCGGPVSNTGIALHTLGVPVTLMGKTGKDFFGDGIERLLGAYGISTVMSRSEHVATSYTVVIVPKGIDRIFLHNSGANDSFCADDISYEEIEKCELFHFGYPPLMKRMYQDGGEELIKMFKAVKAMGVTTSLDMSLPDLNSESGMVDWDGILMKLLPFVDIFMPSIEELSFMLDRPLFNKLQENAKGHDMLSALDISDIPAVADRVMALGAKILCIKCGEKGFYIRTAGKEMLELIGRAKPVNVADWADRELHEESYHVPAVASATGSGDSSIAGFLSAYLRGTTIFGAIRTACAVGGENVQTYDAISGIKTWKQTQDLIQSGWQKNRLDQKSYWIFDHESGVWVGQHDRQRGLKK